MTRVPAVAAASLLKSRWSRLDDPEEPAAVLPEAGARDSANPGFTVRLQRPVFGGGSRDADPTKIGTWTHLLMQHVDLKRSCDERDLKDQARELVNRGILADAEARAIDLSAVAWFWQTEIGRRLRDRRDHVRREWPFVLAVNPSRYDITAKPIDAEDVMLVRGIVDCLLIEPEGVEIVDYKTDSVSGVALRERADLYRGQLAIYAGAVEAAMGMTPRRSWLVFLRTRELMKIGA